MNGHLCFVLRASAVIGLVIAAMLAPASAMAGYADEVLVDNPMGYWRLGEMAGLIAADASGNGISGVYTGGVTLGVPALIADDAAVLTNGIDGRVVLGQPASINALSENFSVEAWIRPNRVSGPTQVIVGNRTYQNAMGGGFGFTINESGLLSFVAYGPRGYDSPDTHVKADAWQHVAITFDSELDVRFYINGELSATVPGTTTLLPSFESLTIGRNPVDPFGTGIGQFDGIIDEVAIYGNALGANDVERHFLAAVIPGDSSLDGIVDGGDYSIWADNFDDGVGPGGKGFTRGDFTGDGYVTGADYTIWADHYNPTPALATAVPEPSTLALVAIAVAALLAYAARRHHAWFV